ncbi:pancreatic lipase-related protein 2 isoform X2 [Folsomia candida]|nr:pancreatic lipase-related protein 2 isoform X2 [Folsomia candida]
MEGLKQLKKDLVGPSDIGQVSFQLFHPSKPKNEQWEIIGTGNSTKIKTTGLKSGKSIKIAIHGFLQTCNISDSNFPEVVFRAYESRKKGEYNFICVDWGPLANPGKISQIMSIFHYPKAVNNTLIVGDATNKLIEALISAKVLKDKETIDVHLIGHSLGSHIAGVAGHEYYFLHKKKKRLARISGLDPAGPAFYEKGKSDKCKLGANDAVFVDTICTNMGQLGTKEMLGHANFILNGGIAQPFCKKDDIIEDIAEKVSGICSHASSVQIFAKSIKENIKSCKCLNWNAFQKSNGSCKTDQTILLGDKVALKSRGNFCLNLTSL